ncbi:MAG: tRNA dihydrouridine(20/20a) synthase DusA [Proteobacteria bacterium]|nr:tRNA dihydrouridine(20/20a) synthase DusA [Pseudomonadota bacterium]
MGMLDRRISVAPMMDWTDRHCRYFLRGFSRDALLYTEMITAAAILRGDRDYLLGFDPEEHPVALQLGGSEPHELAEAARIGEAMGYDEINLNCGCPSERVARGAFGACLMLEPSLVAECVAAMSAAVRVPVTVKMRIGVITARAGEAARAVAQYGEGDFAHLVEFVGAVTSAGCRVAIVHARQAVLGGLTPKDNREVPPLRYEVVRALRREFPHLPLVVNGGFRDVASVREALTWSDGVMLGREAYHRPYLLAQLQESLGADHLAPPDPAVMMERMARYAGHELARGGVRLSSIARHMLGLMNGQPGAREFRRALSEGARAPAAGPDLFQQALRRARATPAFR